MQSNVGRKQIALFQQLISVLVSRNVPKVEASNIVDKSGRAIVALLQEAANLAQENTGRAASMAHRLSMELREAEDRIKQLEADARLLEARAVRAEQ